MGWGAVALIQTAWIQQLAYAARLINNGAGPPVASQAKAVSLKWGVVGIAGSAVQRRENVALTTAVPSESSALMTPMAPSPAAAPHVFVVILHMDSSAVQRARAAGLILGAIQSV
ncbi:MAG: hypothetical protein EBZ48_04590 [Proteobacteria bacterium]|nr:hypothetical protein [Pseudomonadota bacterium]